MKPIRRLPIRRLCGILFLSAALGGGVQGLVNAQESKVPQTTTQESDCTIQEKEYKVISGEILSITERSFPIYGITYEIRGVGLSNNNFPF